MCQLCALLKTNCCAHNYNTQLNFEYSSKVVRFFFSFLESCFIFIVLSSAHVFLLVFFATVAFGMRPESCCSGSSLTHFALAISCFTAPPL